jgi:hypothetical protein
VGSSSCRVDNEALRPFSARLRMEVRSRQQGVPEGCLGPLDSGLVEHLLCARHGLSS